MPDGPTADAPPVRPGFRAWALEQVNDLTVLEVNTILKPDITARPVGSLALAMLEVAQTYASALQRIGLQHGPPSSAPITATRVDRTTLLAFSTAAQDLLQAPHDSALPPPDAMILKRIMGNCIELAAVLERVSENTGQPTILTHATLSDASKALAQASPMDQSRVRKIRDIGIEVVVAQSRIHLDGDVVTRISPRVLEPTDGAMLLQVHRDGVDRSVGFWQQLAELGIQVLRQAWNVTQDLRG